MAKKINPSRITLKKLVEILRAAGSTTVTLESIQRDIAAGAPVNTDGKTVNLVRYAAWLASGGKREN